ncbi:MAG: transglycosylase SLT domain-containing protein [Rhodospirillales bacterium]|nr:transglycosylase SLT domain-containing protein [Rhodospirillales bacterium]MCB9996916.1 transglycosylase SLT domain-containing protein [Rhodospirillales bacterium]
MSETILNNNALASMARRAAPQVLHAIKTASARTGVNFAYLMEQAAAESSFNAKAESKSSSASGLYQFIESTWLNMVKKYGHKHGLSAYADKISDNGKVGGADRQAILELRKNPEKAALLAAEFAAENQRYLDRHVGGDIGGTELYFAHFMGAGGAAAFLNAMKDNPLQNAADLFPKAARANYNVFYDRKTGEARTLAGVYEFFDKKFQASGDMQDMPATAPTPSAKPRFKPALQQISQDMALNNMVETLVMKPFAADSRTAGTMPVYRGSKMNFGSRTSLVFNPAELMLLAQGSLPTDQRPNGKY